MSTASGVVLIAAGLGVGLYALSGPQGDVSAPEPASAAAPGAPSAPAPATPVTTAAVPPPAERPHPGEAPAPSAAAAAPTSATIPPAAVIIPSPAPAAVIIPPKSQPVAQPASAPAVVALPPHPAEPVTAPAPAYKVAALPGDRAGIARELQRELKRAGCYDGVISGTWTPASRRAMKAFTNRVNATLPIDQPDYILLTLVRSHQNAVCGAACPSGQVLTEGRCLPHAVVASARKTLPHPGSAWPSAALTEKIAPPAPAPAPTQTAPPEGRMALAGPKPDVTPPAPATERIAVTPPTLAAPEAIEPAPARKHRKAAHGPRLPAAMLRKPPPRYVVKVAPYNTPWARGFYRRLERN